MPKFPPLTAGAFVVENAPTCPTCGLQRLFDWDNGRLVRAALKAWKGLRVVVTIAGEEQKRSLRANAYLFGVVYKLAIPALVDAGYRRYTAEELHALMKERHNPLTIMDPFTGEEKRIGGTTTTLSVEDFGVFIERVMVDLATLSGCSFPEPRKHEEWREGRAA